MKKNLLSLFSGCDGMDIGFEGGFKMPKATINYFTRQILSQIKIFRNPLYFDF